MATAISSGEVSGRPDPPPDAYCRDAPRTDFTPSPQLRTMRSVLAWQLEGILFGQPSAIGNDTGDLARRIDSLC